jgi:diacylglycerol kinase (ATP)
MPRKKLLFIANRMAGQGQPLRILHAARRSIWGWDCEFHVTPTSDETLRRLVGLDPAVYEAVFVIGGDGTVNSVLKPLLNQPIPLGVLPGGTANDLARKLGIAVDWELVQQLVDRQCTDHIDLAEVNGRPFATVGGVGVGAHIAREFNERRSRSGAFKQLSKVFRAPMYSVLTAKTVLLDSTYVHDMRVTGDGFCERLRTAAIFVANQSSLGGEITVAPSALINDTRLDVVVVRDTSRRGLVNVLQALRRGHTPPTVLRFTSCNLHIQDMDGRPIPAFGDGELLAESPHLTFSILPRALHVYRQDRLLDAIE